MTREQQELNKLLGFLETSINMNDKQRARATLSCLRRALAELGHVDPVSPVLSPIDLGKLESCVQIAHGNGLMCPTWDASELVDKLSRLRRHMRGAV